MKKLIAPILLIVALVAIVKFSLATKPAKPTTDNTDAETFFVWVRADSLENCIRQLYGSKAEVKKSGSEFRIVHERGKLLDDGRNGLRTDLDSLSSMAKDEFGFKQNADGRYEITLKAKDSFVHCPTALLYPLLEAIHSTESNK